VSDDQFVRVCPTHELPLDGLSCPRRHHVTNWKVVDRRKGIAVSAADLEKGETAMLREELMVQKDEGPKTKVLDRARFVDGTGLVLWLHLTTNKLKIGGDPFRIRWRTESADARRKTEQGYVATAPAEPEARKRFTAAVEEAKRSGWSSQDNLRGGRGISIKPIPKPVKPIR
jgi:hypothetical protein